MGRERRMETGKDMCREMEKHRSSQRLAYH